MALAFLRIREISLHLGRDLVQRVREQTRPKVSWTLRLTFASVAAYVTDKWLYPSSTGLLAALTALLVTETTLFSVVRAGFDRVLSVFTGVAIAVLFSSLVGLTWWSLGLLVAASLLAGMLLRLGSNLVEAPISAMLVLAVGATQTAPAAHLRIFETLIGACVGMLINIALPPGVRIQNAGLGIRNFAEEIAHSLDRTGDQLIEGVSAEQASAWLTRARNFSNTTSRLDSVLNQAQESRQLNVRALATPKADNAMRDGLDALEHTSVAVRSLFRGINDVVHYPDNINENDDEVYPQQARELTSIVMIATAAAIREFGELVNYKSLVTTSPDTTRLNDRLDELDEIRHRARMEFRNDSLDRPVVHEMNVFLVATVGRVMRELDPIEHSWLTSESPKRIKMWRRNAG